MKRPKEATNEEQHRRHFYRLFSLVLRIRSRDRARNDITASYELHLRNTGMPTNLHRCSSSEWFSGRNGKTRHARKVPSDSSLLLRSFFQVTLWIGERRWQRCLPILMTISSFCSESYTILTQSGRFGYIYLVIKLIYSFKEVKGLSVS